ncbi:hypothetical protein [Sinomicrobium weinanense]|uniref:Uncharacterized protein n=1 Tax=Sinomicrobium weinanense TaxID=2842200 RepID=A0A926Q2W1_9FLAO|nr:hypothetical protein [Sinomicrobium weinanense]MBC9795100.1 hypothetical protein [Sinomicrobium weinanense]MBU3123769.1 hypothetical protein [Sinomicrobium weinanense]
MKIKYKLILSLVFFWLGTTIILGQRLTPPRFYAGFEGFNRNILFKEEGYIGFMAGSELFSFKFIAPELEVGYYTGTLGKNEEAGQNALPPGYDGPATISGYTSGGFHGWSFSLTPKLFFGDEDFRFLILPKYTLAGTNAYASYYKRDSTGGYYDLVERDDSQQTQSYFTIGIGFEGHIFETEKLSLAFIIQYSGWNIREMFKSLDVKGLNERQQGTRAIGLGLRLYFNPFVKD